MDYFFFFGGVVKAGVAGTGCRVLVILVCRMPNNVLTNMYRAMPEE